MTAIDTDYYDGKSANRIAATVTVVGDVAVIAYDGGSSEFPVSTVKVQSQLKGVPCRLDFPDGSAAVTNDHDAVTAAFGTGSIRTIAHRLESHLGFVFMAMAGVVVAIALGYVYGVPFAAREIAQRLPDGIESQLAEASMGSLDSAIFEPSKIAEKRRDETLKAFEQLRAASNLPKTVRLEFRDGGWIGPNALALPGGVVVVTDQLIDAMQSVDETAAVLAHELGHVENRHSLRTLLQSSITALAATAIYGDVGALTTMTIAGPTVLAHTGYSRDFEREADDFAFVLLKKTGRSPLAFASAMRALEMATEEVGKNSKASKLRKRLGFPDPKPTVANSKDPAAVTDENEGTRKDEKSADMNDVASNKKIPEPEKSSEPRPGNKSQKSSFGYLSTHPATAERIRAAEAAASATAAAPPDFQPR